MQSTRTTLRYVPLWFVSQASSSFPSRLSWRWRLTAGSGAAEDADLDDLFDALRDAGPEAAPVIEGRIWAEWSKSRLPDGRSLARAGPGGPAERRAGACGRAHDRAHRPCAGFRRGLQRAGHGIFPAGSLRAIAGGHPHGAFPQSAAISQRYPASGSSSRNWVTPRTPSRRGARPSPSIRIKVGAQEAIDRLQSATSKARRSRAGQP